MTTEEVAQAIEEKNIQGKLKGLLLKEFPNDVKNAEDWTQKALMRVIKNASAFYDADGIIGYAREVAIWMALKDKERTIERRRALKGHPRYKKARDPMRYIDYKIDLERAIRRTVREQTLQAALWEIHYERSTWEEVINDCPGGNVSNSGWRARLWKANQALRKEMRRKEYGRKS